ncbi:Adaptive-response sensory-kinase SasA [Streptomyces alboniger]
MLETVNTDADRVTRLIAELLDISRIDSGRLELRRQPVDIGAAVGRHIQAYVAAGLPADRFLLRLEQPLPDLWADPDKVDQVLSNLLENAVRHGEGTVTIDITPTASPREGESHDIATTSVTVSDEGADIPEESMNRVFTRFWQGQRARWHRPRALHRQGHRRGPRRHHHGRPRARWRRGVPYVARERSGLAESPRAHPPIRTP